MVFMGWVSEEERPFHFMTGVLTECIRLKPRILQAQRNIDCRNIMEISRMRSLLAPFKSRPCLY